MRTISICTKTLVVTLAIAIAPAAAQPAATDDASPANRTAISPESAAVRKGPAYNPALRVPQAISTTTGVSPYQSGAYARERARTEAQRNPTFSSGPANVAGYSGTAGGVGAGLPPGSARPASTGLGTARYLSAYPGSGLQSFGNAIPSLGQVSGGGSYYPSYQQPGAAGGVQRPFSNIAAPGTATDVYRNYWPLMLDRDVQGRYLLDAADIYFMTRGGSFPY